VASRAGAGDETAGFGCTGTGTTTTVDGDGGVASVPPGGVAGDATGGAASGGSAARAVDTAKGTREVRRARVWVRRAVVFIEEVRPCIR
jgi:hypothetical protein